VAAGTCGARELTAVNGTAVATKANATVAAIKGVVDLAAKDVAIKVNASVAGVKTVADAAAAGIKSAANTTIAAAKVAVDKTVADALKKATDTVSAVKVSADKAATNVSTQAASSAADINAKAAALAASIKANTSAASVSAKLNSTATAIKASVDKTVMAIKAGTDSTLSTLVSKVNASVDALKSDVKANVESLAKNVTSAIAAAKDTTAAKVNSTVAGTAAGVAAVKNAVALTTAVVKNITSTIKNNVSAAAAAKPSIAVLVHDIKSKLGPNNGSTNGSTAAVQRLAAAMPVSGSTVNPAQLALLYQAAQSAGVPLPDVATMLTLGQGVIIPVVYSLNNLTDLVDQVVYSVAHGSPLLTVNGKTVVPGLQALTGMVSNYLQGLNSTVVPASVTGTTTPVTLLSALAQTVNVSGLVDAFVLNVTGSVVDQALTDLKSALPMELAPFVPNNVSPSSLKDVLTGLKTAVAATPKLGASPAPVASNQRTGAPTPVPSPAALPMPSVAAVKQAALALLPTVYEDLTTSLQGAGVSLPAESTIQSFITNLPETAPTTTNGVDPTVVNALAAGVASALRSSNTSSDITNALSSLVGPSTSSTGAAPDATSVVGNLLSGLGLGGSSSTGSNLLQNVGAALSALLG